MCAVAIGSRAEQGSSIRIDLGLDGDGPGDAQALLLAAREAVAGLLQAVRDLVPQAGTAQAASRRSRPCRPCRGRARGCAGRRRRCRRSTSGTGWASGTPCRPARGAASTSTLRVVDVPGRRGGCRPRPGSRRSVVHPVEAAQEGGLAAAGGADQRRHLPVADVEVDVEQRLLGAVPEIDLARRHLGGRRPPPASAWRHRGRLELDCHGYHRRLEPPAEIDGDAVHDDQEEQQHDDRSRGQLGEARSGLSAQM